MALPRLLLAWLAVLLWFLLWQEVRRRIAVEPDRPSVSLRLLLVSPIVESLLLTLFAALWFASLGHGGWGLLFGLVAGLVEIPVRLRQHRTPLLPWREVLLGIVRIVAAGGLLAWRLG